MNCAEQSNFSIITEINVIVGWGFFAGGGKFRLIYSGGKYCAHFSVGGVMVPTRCQTAEVDLGKKQLS